MKRKADISLVYFYCILCRHTLHHVTRDMGIWKRELRQYFFPKLANHTRVGNCGIDIFKFRHHASPKFWNCESVCMRPKFCSQLLKAPKVKVKANEIHQKWIKLKLYIIEFCETRLTFVKLHKLLFYFANFCLILLKLKRFMLNVVKMTLKIHQKYAEFC